METILDDTTLIGEIYSYKIKTFNFKFFRKVISFRIMIESYPKHRISEPVEVCKSSEQAAFICSNGNNPDKDKSNFDYIIQMPDNEYLDKCNKYNNTL